MHKRLALLLALWISSALAETPEQWEKIALAELEEVLRLQPIVKRPKNVLFFLGDGMGISTLTAGRIYKGQLNGKNGEEGSLVFEKFPWSGLSKTYNDDFQTPDSAGTATAYFCGQKAALGVIGVNSNVKLGDCAASKQNAIPSILQWAQSSGKATGLVTTTRITHATPAATYAHSPDRDWEADADVPEEDRYQCEDIAKQLITGTVGRNLNVIFGGGRRAFLPENSTAGKGYRLDGLDLIHLWNEQKEKEGRGDRSFYIDNWRELDLLDAAKTDHVLGLFSSSHMEYELLKGSKSNEPSLKDMVKKAIQILSKNPNGFHLVVEGGRIDHAHHDGMAKLALHELVTFDEAIAAAMEMVPEDESLFVVTADHSHTLSLVGYPRRGNSILGFGAQEANDGLVYTSLSYANGPGAVRELPRRDLTMINTEDPRFMQDALIPLTAESHGGEDVAIYAKGPFSHLFVGLHEQHFIAHAIDYAACYRKKSASHCSTERGPSPDQEVHHLRQQNHKYNFLRTHHL